MAKLETGDRFEIGGKAFIVLMANESRAQVIPESARQVAITSTPSGACYYTHDNAMSISPNAEVTILARGGKLALDDFLAGKLAAPDRENQNINTNNDGEDKDTDMTTTTSAPTTKTVSKKNVTAPKAPKTPAPPKATRPVGDTKKFFPREGQVSAGAATDKAPTAEAPKAKTEAAPKARRVSKCSRIDDLLESGKYTKSQICDMVMKEFNLPETARMATRSTINVRPSHMTKAGRKANWLPEAPESK